MHEYTSRYHRRLQQSLIAVLLLLTLLFYLGKERSTVVAAELPLPDIPIDVLPPPKTIQNKKPPCPSRPAVAEIDEEPEIAEDVDIERLFSGEIDTEAAPPPDEEAETFLPYSKAPVLVKRVVPVYPPMAKRLGVSGTVYLKIFVNKKGRVEKAEVIKSNPMLERAAIEAVMKFEFQPALQRDRKVGVWISIPVRFVLK
ncbi:MAG TPA: energy transducer TonB [Caldithrix abyssi]|uniref:Energy transducer TonB n=1 Tax=Caldithrix abyssi TaxID=187145 RepID=A0A7V5RN99_CALAY|nr:energy transducer TonB [Caldithrix abyssi]